MRLAERFGLTAVTVLLLGVGISSSVRAEPVLTNGGFETGDYTGWVVAEGAGSLPTDGTWGIAQTGQTINLQDHVFDFYDQILVQQNSFGLPRTHVATNGNYMAIQLQNGGQDHRLFQDISLPGNAMTLSWDMFYSNQGTVFAPDQYLAVHIRDLNDNILETLFVTSDASPLAIPMGSFAFDISNHAGSAVRIDVEMKVHQHFLDAGFDNFRIELAETDAPVASSLAPPGWSRGNGKKLAWAEYKKENAPRGFEKGQKKGWEK